MSIKLNVNVTTILLEFKTLLLAITYFINIKSKNKKKNQNHRQQFSQHDCQPIPIFGYDFFNFKHLFQMKFLKNSINNQIIRKLHELQTDSNLY